VQARHLLGLARVQRQRDQPPSLVQGPEWELHPVRRRDQPPLPVLVEERVRSFLEQVRRL